MRQLRKLAQIISQHKNKLKRLRTNFTDIRELIFTKLNPLDRLLLVKVFTKENCKFVKVTSIPPPPPPIETGGPTSATPPLHLCRLPLPCDCLQGDPIEVDN